MTELKINIDDYVSEEHKRIIAIDAVRTEFSRQAKENFERLVSNTAYNIVGSQLDTIFNGELESLLTDQVKKIVSDQASISHISFRGPDAWDREPNKGYAILQEAFTEHRDILKKNIKAKFDDQIKNLSKEYIVDALQDLMIEIVENRLLKTNED